ncbi:ubiquitin domain-containing protein DSK2 [Drosophila ficusphila]|uniref:ubiquitin domain-containing protein DSK2 n=1 Tax=Drosophila ficusphila TaxID=30025 RepID=UPI0007E61E75|nr:ubiquitin domain-containing protein DSK2 [Drosophila ficusphila]
MQITIKVLKGQDCTLDVMPTSTILEVKQQIEKQLHISAANQKLLLLGRPLNNEQTISSYPNIKDGSKLNLVVMKPCLRDSILRGFRKHYPENQAERLTNEFMADFERKINEQSLDDLERLADSIMSRAGT